MATDLDRIAAKFTPMEAMAAVVLIDNAHDMSGGDWALMEECKWPTGKDAFSTLLDRMETKGLIHQDEVTTEQLWTQIAFANEFHERIEEDAFRTAFVRRSCGQVNP
jgi:hypothetical protein